MECPRCHAQTREGLRFCEDCGGRLTLTCSQCGAELGPGKRFCGSCGAPVGGQSAGRTPSPESYTPKHLAEKILTSKAALEGERKQVTVLFADLKGSMELLADRDPEEARKLLDPVLERMMEAVHLYEGTVNQVMGDGIMALFGAPVAHEDHAVRACYAALRMQKAVAQYAESVFRSHGIPLQIRVGLNSGEVVVRAIGSDLHMDYTAVGQTTHLAARMEQMATPGTILLAPATLRLVEGYVDVAARGPVMVKGVAEPVDVYGLTGVSAQRTRLHAAAARGLTRFVGRDAELEQIRRALALAQDGRGQLVAIVGEPGVGKSRLVYEVTHSHRTQDWLVLEASSASYGQATSYLPVIDLLRAYFKVNERETPREIREKVTGKLLTLDRAFEPILPTVLALLDMPVEDASWQAFDPAQRRQRTLDAVKRLLLRETQAQPVLLVFEDLHWIDAESQALLEVLVESLPTARLLLLVNYRPEYRHGWGHKTYYTQLRLDALPPTTAGELLQALLGDDPGMEPLKRLLVRRGNPLFVEESVRTLVETGVLAGERGAYRLTRPIQTIEVPATVQAILAARIDRLSLEDKQLLQTASVIGKDVPLTLLQSVAELAEGALQLGLTRLHAAEFLYEARLFPEPEYTFKHALTHEVTYGTLLQERRKILHARIVGAIERAYPDRLTEHVERLAHHAVRGEMWEQAVTYLRQSGAKAMARSANPEALSCFKQALTALRHLPETRERMGQAIDLRFDLRNALYPLGQLDTLHGHLRDAEVLAVTLDDPRRLGWVSVYLSQQLWVTGHPTEARTFGQRALANATTVGDFALTAVANYHLGLACHASGDYRQAERCFKMVVQLLDGDRCLERCGLEGFPALLSRGYLAWTLAERGQFREGIVQGQDGLRIAQMIDSPFSLTMAHRGLGSLHCIQGDFDNAVPVLERGLALARDSNMTLLLPTVMGWLGYAYAVSGRGAEGLALLCEAAAGIESMGIGAFHALRCVQLGEAYLLTDRLEDALVCTGRALTLAREGSQRGYEAWALRLRGEVTARRDPPEHAAGHYRDALALAEELDMRPLVAHCHLGLGKLYLRTGDQAKAREHLTTATALYREMGMTFWLEKVEAERGGVER